MPTVNLSKDEMALVIEALNDNAEIFDEGAKDYDLTADEREGFAVDAGRCRTLAARLEASR